MLLGYSCSEKLPTLAEKALDLAQVSEYLSLYQTLKDQNNDDHNGLELK